MADQEASASMPVWKGLFEWSMKHADGTGSSNAKEMDPERYQFLNTALQHYVVDLPKRIKEIKGDLESRAGQTEDTLKETEALMDELLEIVHDLDYARDLHSIGGLPMVLSYLASPHPSLRWRAAEVVGTCVQNNATLQGLFLDGGVLLGVVRQLEDSDAAVLAKAIYALGSLVRNHDRCMDAFRGAGAYGRVVELTRHGDQRVARRASQLLEYIVRQSRDDRVALCHVSGFMAAALGAATSDDAATRQAALQTVFELMKDPSARGTVLGSSAALSDILRRLSDTHASLSDEDREALREEGVLVAVLTRALEKAQSQA